MVRGDVYWVKAPRDARGREQQGSRYGVVVQSDRLLGLSTVLIAPTSTGAPQSLFRVEIDIEGVRTRVLVEQVRAVTPDRFGRFAGRLSGAEMIEVDEALRLVLGL